MRKLILALSLLLVAASAHAQRMTPPWEQSAGGCAFNTVPPTLTSGWLGFLQCDSTGNLRTTATIGAPTITDSTSTALEGARVFKASAGTLYRVTLTITTVSGWLMIFNATSAPADGAVTPAYCAPVLSNGTTGFIAVDFSGAPRTLSTGITAVFSSTGCFTKTTSATGYFNGGFQ